MAIQFPANPVDGDFLQVTPEKKYRFTNGAWKLHTNNQPIAELAPVPVFPPLIAEEAPSLTTDDTFWFDPDDRVLYFKKIVGGVPLWEPAQRKELSAALATGVIDVQAADMFTKTVTAPVTFSVANVPPVGEVSSFILEITNGGAFAVTWFANIRWTGGTLPTLSAAGVDIIGFYSRDGGATWRGFMMSADSKVVA